MARIYANRCERGLNFIEGVMKKKFTDEFKAETRALIEADGYTIDEDGTVHK